MIPTRLKNLVSQHFPLASNTSKRRTEANQKPQEEGSQADRDAYVVAGGSRREARSKSTGFRPSSCKLERHPEKKRHEGAWHNDQREGQGVYTWPNGTRYEGAWHNDQREGQGVYTWPNGTRYEGAWHSDQREGQGVLTWPNDRRYEGAWHNDQREGQGALTWPNGTRYEGAWHNDQREGLGVLTWPNGMRYEGMWRNDQREGQGAQALPNGERYEGLWRNDQREGQGVLTRLNGERYEGAWHNDQQEGHGVFVWPTGQRYEGAYQNGRREGHGVQTLPNGERYEGMWRNDQLGGQGVYAWPCGERYEGAWHNYQREGQGVLTRLNGERYEGAWHNDEQEGQGVFMWPNGMRYEGAWHHGQHEGQGVFVWPTGERYEGAYHNGRREGHGVLTWPDGGRYEGTWLNDYKNGLGAQTWANGVRHEGLWRNGRQIELHAIVAADGTRHEIPRDDVPGGGPGMQALLADAQNVHVTGRQQRTEQAIADLERLLNFSADPQVVQMALDQVVELLDGISARGPTQTSSWLWRSRAGRSHDLDNALHALRGAPGPGDFTGPILTNKPMADLLAMVWHAIEVYPQHAADETVPPNTTQEVLRDGLLRALAECIEEDSGERRRVCNAGISQRLVSVLQGYYAPIALDNFQVDPRELVSLLSKNFADGIDDGVTQQEVDAFRERSIALARTHFATGSHEMQTFVEHLEAWIAYDVDVDVRLETNAVTPAAIIARLISKFETEPHDQATLRTFRQAAQEELSRHFAAQSPQWREGVAAVVAYCRRDIENT